MDYKQNIMSKNDSPIQQFQDEDQIINHIKDIASELFDVPLNGLRILDFQQRAILYQNPYKSNQKFLSYTQRKIRDDDQQCKSQWITYQNFQQIKSIQFMDSQFENKKNNSPKKRQATDLKRSQLRKNQTAIKGQQKIKQNTKNKNLVNKKTIQQQVLKQEQKKVKQKINLQRLSQYGFMQHTQQSGRLKTEAISQMYKNKQKVSQNELKKSTKSLKTLQQLYQQKQPLYEKYLREKQKKVACILESKVSQQKKEIQTIKSVPQINKNIQVPGTFQERLVHGFKKTEQKKSKIINDMLKNNTFQPQINKANKYNSIESKVKKTWIQDSQVSIHNSQMIQPVSLVKVQYVKQNKPKMKTSKNLQSSQVSQIDSKIQKLDDKKSLNQFSFVMSSTSQLANILQLQDHNQQ